MAESLLVMLVLVAWIAVFVGSIWLSAFLFGKSQSCLESGRRGRGAIFAFAAALAPISGPLAAVIWLTWEFLGTD